MRVESELGCVLHARPWRDTSALLEVLTAGHGRLGLIHRGARRGRRPAATTQPFRLLELGWQGRGELPSVLRAETVEAFPELQALAAVCGLYVNELTVRILPRGLPAPALFQSYCRTLQALGAEARLDVVLRRYELALLQAIGFAPVLGQDTRGRKVQAEGQYRYDRERGLIAVQGVAEGSEPVISGRTALALASGDLDDPVVRREARALLRSLLDPLLGGRPLHSRALLLRLQSAPTARSHHARSSQP